MLSVLKFKNTVIPLRFPCFPVHVGLKNFARSPTTFLPALAAANGGRPFLFL